MGLLIAGIGVWAYYSAARASNGKVELVFSAILVVAAIWTVIILGSYGLSGSISAPQNGGGY